MPFANAGHLNSCTRQPVSWKVRSADFGWMILQIFDLKKQRRNRPSETLNGGSHL